MNFVGIDPGSASGAIGLISEDSEVILYEYLPEDPGEQGLFIHEFLLSHRANFVSIEKVSSMPKQGVSSTFKFGGSFGAIQAAVAISKVPYGLVTPQRWKNMVLKDFNKSDKDSSRIFINRQFPELNLKRKKDHNLTDALCLALYAREIKKCLRINEQLSKT